MFTKHYLVICIKNNFKKVNLPIASSTEGPVLKTLKKNFISSRPATGLWGFRLLHDNASKTQSDYCTRIFKAGKGCRNCAPAVFPRPCPPVTTFCSRDSKTISLGKNTKHKTTLVQPSSSVSMVLTNWWKGLWNWKIGSNGLNFA